MKKSRELLENLLKQLFFSDFPDINYELIITNSAYGLVGYNYISAHIRRVLEE